MATHREPEIDSGNASRGYKDEPAHVSACDTMPVESNHYRTCSPIRSEYLARNDSAVNVPDDTGGKKENVLEVYTFPVPRPRMRIFRANPLVMALFVETTIFSKKSLRKFQFTFNVPSSPASLSTGDKDKPLGEAEIVYETTQDDGNRIFKNISYPASDPNNPMRKRSPITPGVTIKYRPTRSAVDLSQLTRMKAGLNNRALSMFKARLNVFWYTRHAHKNSELYLNEFLEYEQYSNGSTPGEPPFKKQRCSDGSPLSKSKPLKTVSTQASFAPPEFMQSRGTKRPVVWYDQLSNPITKRLRCGSFVYDGPDDEVEKDENPKEVQSTPPKVHRDSSVIGNRSMLNRITLTLINIILVLVLFNEDLVVV